MEQRKIKVGNGCKHLIRTFEQHAYDENGKPEKGGVGMDDLSHAGDAMGYAIYKLAAVKKIAARAASEDMVSPRLADGPARCSPWPATSLSRSLGRKASFRPGLQSRLSGRLCCVRRRPPPHRAG